MAQQNWTKEQRQAIEARGGTLLVSAAAGSGKTAVLVERIVSRITDLAHPCDADRLLVVTFTNAAAAQMRERIAARLSELAAENPGDENLRRQQLLFQNAHVSTIHSFCLDLVRENFQKLGIPPDFRIADDKETALLQKDLLDEILEEHYARALKGGRPAQPQKNPFLQLSALLSTGRGDALLADTVLRLMEFVRSLPEPEQWLDEKLALYHPQKQLGQTLWGSAALRYAADALEEAAGMTRHALAAMKADEKIDHAYGPAMGDDLSQLERALEPAENGLWDDTVRAVQSIGFSRLGPLRGYQDDPLKNEVAAARKSVKELVADLVGGVLTATEDQVNEDISRLAPLVEELFGITKELMRRLFEQRKRDATLDFSDLEQLALRLLVEYGPDGVPVPTPTAREAAAQFDEILVDEYQDVNRAQDAIFRAISRDGRNLFFVGDVKQSIYRFRQAMPELFIEKSGAFAPFDGSTFPARILLSRNFRSRRGVTDSVNFIFRRLMSRRFGEIEYGDDEALVAGADFPSRDGPDFALHMVDASEAGEDADILEARHIASVIRRMVDSGELVGQTGRQRPCRYRDFCILMRATRGHAEKAMRELTLQDIPVWADVSGGYLGSYEVAVMLSLLRVLDNPLQDVPLLSVMLSPVFAFLPDELAALRDGPGERKRSAYLSLLDAAQREPQGRFTEFLALLGQLRGAAAVLPADRLILRVLEKTGFLQVFEAMPPGEKRRANLRLLLNYARSYEAAGYKGLAGFIRFIDRVREDRNDFAPAAAASESADVVRVMSIHKSKGLEFPVVFVAGCAHKFNQEDLKPPAVFSPVYGFGSVLRDQTLDYRYSTLPRDIIRIETKRSTLSEETRVLYVALTRAKEHLFCVLVTDAPASFAKRSAELIDRSTGRLSPSRCLKSQCCGSWLVASALCHPDCVALRELAGVTDLPVPPAGESVPHWEFACIPAPTPVRSLLPQAEALPGPDPSLLKTLEARLTYRYPWRALSKLEAKMTVSELNEGIQTAPVHLARPLFLQEGKLTGAQAGTALHGFMQHARLKALHSPEDVEEEIRRLVGLRLLLPEEGEAVDVGRVVSFLASPVFGRISAARKVYREFQFTLAVPAGELQQTVVPGDENMILQGMADLVFEEEGGYCVLDYKTDHAASLQNLAQTYARQLALYARAVHEIMGGIVKATYLYSFHFGALIEVPFSNA